MFEKMLHELSLKQVLFLMIGKGFQVCEIWNEKDYLLVHHGTKTKKRHLIASKQIELLQEEGLSSDMAHRIVLLSGEQKINKRTLSLLGSPIVTGSVEKLSNSMELSNRTVCDIHIKGLFRRKLIIVLDKEQPIQEESRDIWRTRQEFLDSIDPLHGFYFSEEDAPDVFRKIDYYTRKTINEEPEGKSNKAWSTRQECCTQNAIDFIQEKRFADALHETLDVIYDYNTDEKYLSKEECLNLLDIIAIYKSFALTKFG